MRLICLFFLAILPFQLYADFASREIGKYGADYIYELNIDDIFYVQTKNFPNDDYIYFRITVYYGYFRSETIRYQDYSSKQSGVLTTLTKKQTYDSYSYGNYIKPYYDYYIYYYKVPKPSQNYLYISPPLFTIFTKLDTTAYVSVENTDQDWNRPISIFVWIGIAIFVVVAAAASILIYYWRRKRRVSIVIPTSVEPVVYPSPY